MFTGIVEELGEIVSFQQGSVTIAAQRILEDVHIGDSIAVNGICLTVTQFGRTSFQADVMPETVRRTSLENLYKGSKVNLERALLPTTRMGGHIVTGHIDGTGEVVSFRTEGNAILLQVKAPQDLLTGIVEKGSVALDGISLTVATVDATGFSVSLIPHTRQVTNLGTKREGDLINIETDILGKYVERLMNSVPGIEPSRLTHDFFQKNGF